VRHHRGTVEGKVMAKTGWLWRRFAPALPGLAVITVHETCTARCTCRGV
jgi:hypothetical protein